MINGDPATDRGDRYFLTGEQVARHYAAIVESSDDAILSQDLDGIIRSWNQAAEELFGYRAEEAVGMPVTILIPTERHAEETMILDRVRRGERTAQFETVRKRKDGSLVSISLTVSPMKDESGTVIGASKIVRDITDRKRAQERQEVLLREMDHRVKNLFALAISVMSLSARYTDSVPELIRSTSERLLALDKDG